MTTNSPIQTLPRRQAWNPAGDFYEGLSGFVGSGNRYGYWLPSNIPNVYAATTFGITNTGSTSYPTTTDTLGTTASNTALNGRIVGQPYTPTASGVLISIGLNIKTAGGNLEVGIYSTYSNSKYNGLLGQSASTTEVTGWNDLSVTGVALVQRSTYYVVFQTTSAVFYQAVSGGTQKYVTYTYGPFPDPTPTLTGSEPTIPNMRMIYSQTLGYTKGTRTQYTDTTCSSCVSSFSFYVTNYSPGDRIVLALYSDSSGSPNSELWNSPTNGTDCGATGWCTINEPSGTVDNSWNVGLINGAYYWFVWQWNSVDAGPSYVSGGSNTGIYLAQSFGTLSSTWSGGTLSTENWSMYLTYAPSTTSTTSISTTSTTSISTTSTTSTSTTQSITPSQVKDCTYLIFTDGTNTYMQDCNTSEILMQSTNATSVINDAIGSTTSGGSIFVEHGIYTISGVTLYGEAANSETASIGTTSVSNIEFYGEGNSTIFSAAPNQNGAVFGIFNVNGWYVHDIQINENRNSQSGTGTPIQLNGFLADGVTNLLVSHVYSHDAKTFCFKIEGNDITVRDSQAQYCNANAFYFPQYNDEPNAPNGYGRLHLSGLTASWASDEGISIGGNPGKPQLDVSLTDSFVYDITWSNSPFGANSHEGIAIGDVGPAYHVVIANTIVSGAGYCYKLHPPLGSYLEDVFITQFIASNCGVHALELYNARSVTITNGLFNTTKSDDMVSLGPGLQDVQFSDDTFQNEVPGHYLLYIGTPIENVTVTSNIFNSTSSFGQSLSVAGGSSNPLTSGIFTDNLFLQSRSNPGSAILSAYFVDCIIANNEWSASGSSDVGLASGSVGNLIQGNIFLGKSGTGAISDTDTYNTIIRDNIGYNPLGNIARGFDTNNNILYDTAESARLPNNATTTTIWGSPKLITIIRTKAYTAGHIEVFKIDGTQYWSTSAPSTIGVIWSGTLQPGESFFLQWESGDISIIVSGQ